jgi:hypothetical protein
VISFRAEFATNDVGCVGIRTPPSDAFQSSCNARHRKSLNSTRSRDISFVAAFGIVNALEQLRVGQSLLLPEDTMRSELVFGAMTYVSNRFLLTRLASRATRSFHRPNTRIVDTANGVFERFAHANPLAGVSYAGNLQSFPFAAQGETNSRYEELERSVA